MAFLQLIIEINKGEVAIQTFEDVRLTFWLVMDFMAPETENATVAFVLYQMLFVLVACSFFSTYLVYFFNLKDTYQVTTFCHCSTMQLSQYSESIGEEVSVSQW